MAGRTVPGLITTLHEWSRLCRRMPHLIGLTTASITTTLKWISARDMDSASSEEQARPPTLCFMSHHLLLVVRGRLVPPSPPQPPTHTPHYASMAPVCAYATGRPSLHSYNKNPCTSLYTNPASTFAALVQLPWTFCVLVNEEPH
jgi:hypothetical protein